MLSHAGARTAEAGNYLRENSHLNLTPIYKQEAIPFVLLNIWWEIQLPQESFMFSKGSLNRNCIHNFHEPFISPDPNELVPNSSFCRVPTDCGD